LHAIFHPQQRITVRTLKLHRFSNAVGTLVSDTDRVTHKARIAQSR
jgi:hypothetical protein